MSIIIMPPKEGSATACCPAGGPMRGPGVRCWRPGSSRWGAGTHDGDAMR
ncbi:hypothetical protein LJK88_11625 [Paenibacillus sp. P26]|nr:hypothetical protein LJK88_11625 [Paenibacillus sp. P26]